MALVRTAVAAFAAVLGELLSGCGERAAPPPADRPPLQQDPALSVNPAPVTPPMPPGSSSPPPPPPTPDDSMPPGPVNPK